MLLAKWPGLSVQGLPGTPPGPGACAAHPVDAQSFVSSGLAVVGELCLWLSSSQDSSK